MNFFTWITGKLTLQHRATWLFRRGVAKAKQHDYQGALRDYTATINAPLAPSNLIAMAFYNRALAYVAGGDDRAGITDLGMVLAMKMAPVNVRTLAKQKLARMESHRGDDRSR